MLVDIQLNGAKPRTQETCLREVENLEKYVNRSPAELGETELKEYMLYMIKERRLSDGTFRFYVAGLKFFYRTTLKRDWPVEKLKCPRSRKNHVFGKWRWNYNFRLFSGRITMKGNQTN
jgi:hypothetical protein